MEASTGSAALPEGIEQLRAIIRPFVLSRVRDAAAAEDIAQEVLLRVLSHLGRLRQRDRLRAWIFQIARNAVADYFRSATQLEAFDEQLHGSGSTAELPEVVRNEEEMLRRELAGYIRSLVEGLPEIYREALIAAEYEGVTQTELARRLGLSASGAKSRVQRARAMVKAEMERCCRWETDRYGTVVDVQRKPRSACGCDSEAER